MCPLIARWWFLDVISFLEWVGLMKLTVNPASSRIAAYALVGAKAAHSTTCS